MKRFTVKSGLTGKYLTNLFEDDHQMQFQSIKFDGDACYSYCSRLVAQDVATQLGGTVVEVSI